MKLLGLEIYRKSKAEEKLIVLVESLNTLNFSYDSVGATREDPMPSGYRHDFYEIDLGKGSKIFENAKSGLKNYQAQIGAGLVVVANDKHLKENTSLFIGINLLFLSVVARTRIAYVNESENAFSYAYGTLDGHPEEGEEAFILTIDENENVVLEIICFSKMKCIGTKIGKPVARYLQRRVTNNYLKAMAAHVQTAN